MASNSKTNIKRNNTNNIVNDEVLVGILSVVERNENGWRGTMTELNSALVRVLGRRRSTVLPGSPSSLRVVVNRVVNRLRTRGIGVRFNRTPDSRRTRYVEFITR